MLVDYDVIDKAESLPRALAYFLRREERLKYTLLDIILYPDTVVRNMNFKGVVVSLRVDSDLQKKKVQPRL